MARAGRGHPPAVSVGRVLLADLLVGLAFGAAFFVAIAPYIVVKLRGGAWYWQMVAAGLGVALIWSVISRAKALGQRFEPQVKWVHETYELAKARRDLSVELDKLSGVEQLIAVPLIGIVTFAISLPTSLFPKWAYAKFDWIDSIVGDIVLFLPMLVIAPLMALAFRLSKYVAVHLAMRIRRRTR